MLLPLNPSKNLLKKFTLWAWQRAGSKCIVCSLMKGTQERAVLSAWQKVTATVTSGRGVKGPHTVLCSLEKAEAEITMSEIMLRWRKCPPKERGEFLPSPIATCIPQMDQGTSCLPLALAALHTKAQTLHIYAC